ncbi:hypothetical protein LIER_32611 [Lithospermum erythrorhizon]|uniref:DUF4219 domain-containing protein n=1 Tax=Lithospermum erythrorhizon TaxID=34254 RepID=A0AAV3RUB2_LITER
MLRNNHNVTMSLPILTGEHYDYWSKKMRTYFMSQGLWDLVSTGVTIPANLSSLQPAERAHKEKEIEAKKIKDFLALYDLQMAMDDSVFPRISQATTSKEPWDTLKEEFEGNAKVREVKLQTLWRELENTKMRDSKTIKEYYTRLKEIVNQSESIW